MKKLIIVLMVCMMVGFVANAELHYSNLREEDYPVMGKNGEQIVVKYYYVTITTEGGDKQEIEISASEYNKIEKIIKKQDHDELCASRPWYKNAGAFLTFWNPND
ncbi:hypothetical protein [Pseudobutyrivibrio sp.]